MNKFPKLKTFAIAQETTHIEYQQINNNQWITFILLKTYRLFILSIEKTSIALPKILS